MRPRVDSTVPWIGGAGLLLQQVAEAPGAGVLL